MFLIQSTSLRRKMVSGKPLLLQYFSKMHVSGKKCIRNFCKISLVSTVSEKRKMYRTAGKYRTAASVPYKNKLTGLVFFLDDARFI